MSSAESESEKPAISPIAAEQDPQDTPNHAIEPPATSLDETVVEDESLKVDESTDGPEDTSFEDVPVNEGTQDASAPISLNGDGNHQSHEDTVSSDRSKVLPNPVPEDEELSTPVPPTPSTKRPPPRTDSIPSPAARTPVTSPPNKPTALPLGSHSNGSFRTDSPSLHPTTPTSAATAAHRRSLTLARGRTVSSVLISSALEAIAASKEGKRAGPLKDSVQVALDLVRTGEGGDRPRDIFEPLRLACETRNEKLMVVSLDCISKLISYSFFLEENDSHHVASPPTSPAMPPSATAGASQESIMPPSLVDSVVHTITSCHSENTPDAVSLQIVKSLLSLVLSATLLVHQSSLLKAIRTVYNVFLLSNDPVTQTVAQGGLTQMVNHIFTRCRVDDEDRSFSSPMARTQSLNGSAHNDSVGNLNSPRQSRRSIVASSSSGDSVTQIDGATTEGEESRSVRDGTLINE